MNRNVLYKEYSKRLKFEHDLINRRITWLLTSQTILFAAYGLGAKKDSIISPNFLTVIAISGLVSSLLLFVGIVANALAKHQSWQDYLNVVKECDESQIPEKLENLRKQWGVRSWITRLALTPDLALPLVFLIAWTFVAFDKCGP